MRADRFIGKKKWEGTSNERQIITERQLPRHVD